MKDEAAIVRQFLLGKVTDEERQRIETLFLTDAEVKERIIAAEQELIDDYLEGALTTEDREKFHLRYGQTPEQQQKLRIARSIKEWASAETAVPQTITVRTTSWGILGRVLWSKPALVTSISLAVIIVIVAAVWLRALNEQRNKRLALEQELAQLNSPSTLNESPSQTLDLSPVTVRSGERQAEIKRRSGIRIVELRLPWLQQERYSTYQAEIRRLRDAESFTVPNLQGRDDGGYAIGVRLPTHMLVPGQYQIHLSGIAGDGAPGLAEDYAFAVSD
jgi:hypothetical protein